MTTESDAVLATIVDNWGGGGYGGATPKIQSTTDIAVDRWAALDAVIVLHDTLDELHPPVNDLYVNKQYTMDIRVTSITSEDQLKLLVEETEYLLNNTAITGFTSVRVTRKDRASSDRGRKVYRNDVTIELKALLSASAVAPSGGTLGLTTLASLLFSDGGSTVDIIRDEDDMASDDDEALATQQSIKAYVDVLDMKGSANAAWVPCSYAVDNKPGVTANTGSKITNSTVDNNQWLFQLPLPPTKGGLTLYVSGSRIVITDADGNNKIDQRLLYGVEHTGGSNIDFNGTDLTASGQHEDTFTAIDCSPYDSVAMVLVTLIDTIRNLDVGAVTLRCYYA